MAIEKSRRSLALGVAAAAIFLPLVGMVIYFAMSGVGVITSPHEFSDALEKKQPINCEVTEPNGRVSVLQADKGFKRVKLITENPDGTKNKQYVLKSSGAVYMWLEDGSMAIRSSGDGFVDMMVSDIGRNVAAGATAVKCDTPTMVDFSVPNYKFTDATTGGGQ